jgi:DNA polymerase III subunit delta
MIIFLYGADAFRSGQKIAEIKNKFFKSDSSSSGLSIFDLAENFDLNQIFFVLETANLLAPKRLIIIKNLLSGASGEKQKVFLDFLQKKAKGLVVDEDQVVIFWEKENPKKTNTLFKFLESLQDKIKKQQFEKLSGQKLEQWIVKRIKSLEEKSGITAAAIQKLILFTGGEMFSLENEIQKLVNFTDGKMIQEEDVENLVRSAVDTNIFQTIDALAARNKKEAVKLLQAHLEKGEDPFYLFSMFIYQFRNLLKISDLQENYGADEYAISRITKMHPFVIRKSLGQAKKFSFARLKEIYQKLSELDTQSKTGKMDIRLALGKFIAEL